MKEHNCYWAWLKGRDNQDKLAIWHEIFFREAHPPGLIFARQSQVWMDVIQCCMMVGWTYLALSSFILFASNLEWLVTKIPKGIFSQLCFYVHFIKGITAKSESSCYLSKVLALGQNLVLGKSSNCTQVGEVVSPLIPTSRYLSQDSHNEIYNIYDKRMHLQPPFQSFYQ